MGGAEVMTRLTPEAYFDEALPQFLPNGHEAIQTLVDSGWVRKAHGVNLVIMEPIIVGQDHITQHGIRIEIAKTDDSVKMTITPSHESGPGKHKDVVEALKETITVEKVRAVETNRDEISDDILGITILGEAKESSLGAKVHTVFIGTDGVIHSTYEINPFPRFQDPNLPQPVML